MSISLNTLVILSRALRHNLSAGVSVLKVFRQQAERGPQELRPSAGRIAEQLQKGNSLTAALKRETGYPPLFLALVNVGEETGHLEEIFAALEQYYTLQQQISRKFRSRLIMPLFQFVIAVLIVGFLIWLLTFLAASAGRQFTGLFGLRGAAGAVMFVGIIFGTLLLVGFGCYFVLKKFRGKEFLDTLLLRLPMIGSCVRAFALSRFTLAMYLTLDSRLSVIKAVRLSLQASGNAHFEAQAKTIEDSLRGGENLTLSFTSTDILPEELRHIMAIAEESGRIPEIMRQQSRHYQEEAERKMQTLSAMANWGVWLCYAIFMIAMISQLAGIYFSALP